MIKFLKVFGTLNTIIAGASIVKSLGFKGKIRMNSPCQMMSIEVWKKTRKELTLLLLVREEKK